MSKLISNTILVLWLVVPTVTFIAVNRADDKLTESLLKPKQQEYKPDVCANKYERCMKRKKSSGNTCVRAWYMCREPVYHEPFCCDSSNICSPNPGTSCAIQ